MDGLFIFLLPALLLTLIIESFIILPLFFRHCNSVPKLVINFILINAITNLAVNTLIVFFTTMGINLIFFLELVIPVIEAIMFSYSGVKRSFKSLTLICYIANILSFTLGYIVTSTHYLNFHESHHVVPGVNPFL